MGTHPIFESDFDCLTEFQRKMSEVVDQALAAATDVVSNDVVNNVAAALDNADLTAVEGLVDSSLTDTLTDAVAGAVAGDTAGLQEVISGAVEDAVADTVVNAVAGDTGLQETVEGAVAGEAAGAIAAAAGVHDHDHDAHAAACVAAQELYKTTQKANEGNDYDFSLLNAECEKHCHKACSGFEQMSPSILTILLLFILQKLFR